MRPLHDLRPAATRRPGPRRLAVLAAALALVAAACGGGGDSQDEAARSTTTGAGPAAITGSTTTAAAAQPAGDDQALADAALLQASDLPAGFVASGDGGVEEEAEDPFGPCAEKGGTLSSSVTARAQGPELASDTLSASGGAMVFRDVAAAEAAMDALGSDEVTDCVSESFSDMATLGDEAMEDTMSMAFTSASAPDVGDDATAYHLEMSFPAIFEDEEEGGEEMTLTAEIVFARQGRVVGMYGFAGLEDALPEADREAALAKALARAAAAQA